MGRLTRDPELRHTQTEKAVANFTLAVDRDFDRDTADFIECVAWGPMAEFIYKHFSRGKMAAVTGRLQLRDWTDNSGNKRRAAEVIADNIYFCGDRAPIKLEDIEDIDDGDLPF